jgi:hypothetical protein
MLLLDTKDFALHYIAPQAATDRAKIGRPRKTAVALHYTARQAASDLRLTCGRHALSRRLGKTGGYAASFISAWPERFCMPGYQRQNVYSRFHECRRDRFPMTVPIAVIRDEGFIGADVIAEFLHCLCGRLIPLRAYAT